MRRSAESGFQAVCPYKRCRTVILVFLPHFIRDFYPSITAVQLLPAKLLGKNRIQVFRLKRLTGRRIERRQRLHRHFGQYIIPIARNLLLGQEISLCLFAHVNMLFVEKYLLKIRKNSTFSIFNQIDFMCNLSYRKCSIWDIFANFVLSEFISAHKI